MEGVQIGNLQVPAIKGEKGDTGQAGTIVSINVTMLSTTATAYANNTGTPQNAVIELGIPVGVGISTAEINSDGELELTLTEGTVLNLGTVVGTSVSNVEIDEDYDFVVTLSDGSSIVAGNIETTLTGIIEDALADYYDKDTADGKFALITETGNKIDLSINNTTYVMTLTLKDKSNNTLSTATVDLPLESVVVSGSYDSVNKKIVLTLQSGSTVEFSVADLVSGLQSEITSSNKLSADLVTDTSTTNKFVTASEKSQITTNQTAITNIKDGTSIDSFGDVESALALKENALNKVTSLSSSSTDTQYPSAKCVYDLIGDIETALETLDVGGGVS